MKKDLKFWLIVGVLITVVFSMFFTFVIWPPIENSIKLEGEKNTIIAMNNQLQTDGYLAFPLITDWDKFGEDGLIEFIPMGVIQNEE